MEGEKVHGRCTEKTRKEKWYKKMILLNLFGLCVNVNVHMHL